MAGLEERQREPDSRALELLEVHEGAREDPIESLALVLRAGDLWSVLEVVDAAVAFDRGGWPAVIAERLWSAWHEQRLGDLVRRLENMLPFAAFPAASSAVKSASRAFKRDRRVRTRLRAELLLDALPTSVDVLGLAA